MTLLHRNDRRHCLAYLNGETRGRLATISDHGAFADDAVDVVQVCIDKTMHAVAKKNLRMLKRRGAPVKHKRATSSSERYSPRLGRLRRKIRIVPVVFDRHDPSTHFDKMILKEPYSAFVFNDNVDQWSWAVAHPDKQQGQGGGNAIIRPYEVDGRAIGIPTGFSSLKDDARVRMSDGSVSVMSVDEVLTRAFDRLLKHVLSHPDVERYCFSADANGGLGLGIFAHITGKDVVDRITRDLYGLPTAVDLWKRTGCSLYSRGPLAI